MLDSIAEVFDSIVQFLNILYDFLSTLLGKKGA